MTSEEIRRLIVNSEKMIGLEILTTPLAAWTIGFGSALFGAVFSVFEGYLFAVPVAFVGLFVSFEHHGRWLEFRKRRAELIWRHVNKTVFEPYTNAPSANLVRDIASLYRSDPRGEVLPLAQAVRLVDTHHKQQQRLDVLTARLGQLHIIGNALRQKTQQLRELGEKHEQGETRLQNLREDEAAIRVMCEQTEASCHRLEMILIEARKAQQMRQLHHEINALTQEKPLSSATLSSESHDALGDIERQITREVETFLRLERETDRHLRD
jgi:hypothetical protein